MAWPKAIVTFHPRATLSAIRLKIRAIESYQGDSRQRISTEKQEVI
jgi:hypothetical protein